MADYEGSASQRRANRDITSVVDFEMEKINTRVDGIGKSLDDLKAMPLKFALAIGITFGGAIATGGYKLVEFYIKAESMAKDVKVIQDKLDHGKSRASGKIDMLEYRLKQMETKMKDK